MQDLKARVDRLNGHGSKRIPVVEKTPGVRIELPNGLGLTEDDIKELIDQWIVPLLIRQFIQESNPKKPVKSESIEDTDEEKTA